MSTPTLKELDHVAAYPFFNVPRYYDRIEKLLAVRHTDKSVWVLGKWDNKSKVDRCAMRSDYHCYFPTYELAAAFLRDRLIQRIESANKQIMEANKILTLLDGKPEATP